MTLVPGLEFGTSNPWIESKVREPLTATPPNFLSNSARCQEDVDNRCISNRNFSTIYDALLIEKEGRK